MKRLWTIPMMSFAMLAVATGCNSTSDRTQPGASVPGDLTVEQLYDRMERALAAHDVDILHASLIFESATLDSGTPVSIPEGFKNFKRENYADQIWLDAGAGTGRFETRTPSNNGTPDRVLREVFRNNARFSVDYLGRSYDSAVATCPKSGSTTLALLLGCSMGTQTVTLESGEDGGDAVIILVMRGKTESDSSTFYEENRLFIDPSSYLPHRAEVKSSHDDPTVVRYDYSVAKRYAIEFLKRSSLPGDFFEPASIGYVATAPVPADNLRSEVKGMRVYWPGAEVDAGLSGPLVLQRVEVYPGEFSPGPLAILAYKIADHSSFYRGLGIREFPIGAAEKPDSHVFPEWSGPDVTRENIPFEGGTAELFRLPGRSCPAAFEFRCDLYLVRIQFDTTIIIVADNLGAPPYTGRDSMLRVVAALHPYQ